MQFQRAFNAVLLGAIEVERVYNFASVHKLTGRLFQSVFYFRSGDQFAKLASRGNFGVRWSFAIPWTLVFICLFIFRIFGEPLNVETLPLLRTQQYPIDPCEKIVVFSAPRTGSSLVYNVFRYLFENEKNFLYAHNEFNLNCLVLKTHRFDELDSFKDFNVFFVATLRNPIDSIISHFRVCSKNSSNIRNFVERRMEMYMSFLRFYEGLKRAGKNVIFFKYEDFENNMGYIFEEIENRFGLQINQEDKNLMQMGYGRENVNASVGHFVDFQGYLPISGFHGSHISEVYKPPEELMFWIHKSLEKVKPEFRKYGYFLD